VSAARFVAVGLLTAFAVYQALWANLGPDFFINRAGAEMGRRGESPYDRAKVQALVAHQYPNDRLLHENCGYFLPPQAVIVFAPFAALPYPAAKVLWALVTGLCAAAGLFVLRAFVSAPLPRGGQLLLPLVLSVNYLTVLVVELGQTSLLFVGCVAAGLWCFERKWLILGVVLWSVCFVKPHLALPLVPLAWYLGGWKRAAALVALVAALNLLGATLVGGSPLYLREYVAYLGSAHKAVMFNRVAANPEITSWNRLLYALTEPIAGERLLVELTATKTLVGFAVWFALVAGRCRLAGAMPPAAWATAAAAVGSVLCAQALPYDVLLLVLVVPWVRALFAGGYWLRGWLTGAVLFVQLVPLGVLLPLGVSIHRPLGVALAAVLVLVGPVREKARGELNRSCP
jgi:hypothetical protein